jgi:hypothetical protein
LKIPKGQSEAFKGQTIQCQKKKEQPIIYKLIQLQTNPFKKNVLNIKKRKNRKYMIGVFFYISDNLQFKIRKPLGYNIS